MGILGLVILVMVFAAFVVGGYVAWSKITAPPKALGAMRVEGYVFSPEVGREVPIHNEDLLAVQRRQALADARVMFS